MAGRGGAATMPSMISTASKVVLIPDNRPAAQRLGVRRYRLARLALNPGPTPADGRFGHLKRCYD